MTDERMIKFHKDAALNQQMKTLLSKLNIGFDEVTVLGGGAHISVRCESRNTADKWVLALAAIFKGSKVIVAKAIWNAAINKGVQLNPTRRNGFYISASA